MYVKNITVKNYRNYHEESLTLNSNLNIFVGENAQGKTNLSEAIYFISSLKSHRTSKNNDLINWNAENCLIRAVIERDYGDENIEIFISKKDKNYIKVNGLKITKAAEILGKLNVVMFSPEDLKLVKEGPGVRRKFLDYEMSQIRPKYHYLINKYNKILNQRNNILKSMNFQRGMETTLEIFTEQLIDVACEILIMRVDFVNRISIISKGIHSKITNGGENLDVSYISDVKEIKNKDDVKKSLTEMFKKSLDKEIKKGYTIYGPHRDDLIIKINGIDVRNFGSQGQQRSAALSLKLSELEIIKDIVNEYPVLILDDVLSELDENRQKYLIEELNNIQVILTCTSASDVDMFKNEKKDIYKVKNGLLYK